jgi:hypothetical protein
MKTLITFLLLPAFIAALSFSPGYSADPAGKPSLLEKVRKSEKAMGRNYPPKRGVTSINDKQMATKEKMF